MFNEDLFWDDVQDCVEIHQAMSSDFHGNGIIDMDCEVYLDNAKMLVRAFENITRYGRSLRDLYDIAVKLPKTEKWQQQLFKDLEELVGKPIDLEELVRS